MTFIVYYVFVRITRSRHRLTQSTKPQSNGRRW
jgi:hypothetical protein